MSFCLLILAEVHQYRSKPANPENSCAVAGTPGQAEVSSSRPAFGNRRASWRGCHAVAWRPTRGFGSASRG